MIDEAVGWRNCIRIICAISWGVAIPMFFVPEPVRNETNRLAMQELKEQADQDSFGHLEVIGEDKNGVPSYTEGDPIDSQTKVSAQMSHVPNSFLDEHKVIKPRY